MTYLNSYTMIWVSLGTMQSTLVAQHQQLLTLTLGLHLHVPHRRHRKKEAYITPQMTTNLILVILNARTISLFIFFKTKTFETARHLFQIGHHKFYLKICRSFHRAIFLKETDKSAGITNSLLSLLFFV